ncbi:trafficking protein particle complex subunit 13 isoform X1 [Daphnia magna]|uniref:trafficking protein particle complex subunit 13 isoform X1 n=2 Tax=Daphnia magna TaxID=35525 RepID=UPI0006E94447|nr:trafficking protein particle complex subunit 13 isoform X1 [Daphnia magna]
MENKADQVLSIKVMRLSRPLFTQCDPHHLEFFYLTDTKPSAETDCYSLVHADHDLDMTLSSRHGLLLPQSFGTIYLGETFQSYLRVQNVGSFLVSNISIKADLQTAAQRLPLTKKKNNVTLDQLEPQQSTDDILSHEITELGTHILVCEVSYQVGLGEVMTSSRYYKFQVLKPLDVKTKFYNAESDDVYLEAQIQNTTLDKPLCLDKVTMEPSSLFKVQAGWGTSWSNASQLFGGIVNIVQPGEIRQYLHCLKPKQDVRGNLRLLRGESNIGKLDLTWRTTIGDRGRLQTSQLQRMVPNYGDVRLTIQELPNPVKLYEAISFVCKITNTRMKRLYSLERRFNRDEDFTRKYDTVVKEYIGLDHARLLTTEQLWKESSKTWYLPHHGVVSPSCSTTKVRVIFDGAAEYAGTSIKQNLLRGPIFSLACSVSYYASEGT